MRPDPERYAHVYCRSRQQKIYFEDIARQKKTSVSRLLLSLAEDGLLRQDRPAAPRNDKELDRLRQTLRERDLEIQALRSDLNRIRTAGWADARKAYDSDGQRTEFSGQLEAVLRRGPVNERALLEAMEIDRSNLAAIRTLSQELETLEAFGLIQKGVSGWQWIS
ncbi:MAG: hypothetical protein A4E45_00072 [Methanosaeta sp. PtaB.Bin039]|nr:MAG: hypothetical protein A4E45_00072 [Methanosaeta sp. PtaB.Bin039]